MRLLVVEDEERLRDLVRQALADAGFTVDALGTAAAADDAIALLPYDAAVLDLGLPDGDGIKVIRSARRAGRDLPILVLTARDAVADRVLGLDSGADDYLVKPFAMTELLARIKALLRRPGGVLGLTLESGNLRLDTVGREVQVDGTPVQMPRHEFAILEQMMRRHGRVVPKAVLEEKIYGLDAEPESNTIPVHVHHLRRRLGAAGARVSIHTVRGVGYMLADAP
jgi:DNA-binding response OmpR family regulator